MVWGAKEVVEFISGDGAAGCSGFLVQLLPFAMSCSIANNLCGDHSIGWPQYERANMPLAFIFLRPFKKCAVSM